MYERNDEGNVINPPTDPDFERRLADAHNRADQRTINRISDEYADWRDQRIKDDEADEQDDRVPAENLNATPGDGAGTPQGAPSQTLGADEPVAVADTPTADTTDDPNAPGV